MEPDETRVPYDKRDDPLLLGAAVMMAVAIPCAIVLILLLGWMLVTAL